MDKPKYPKSDPSQLLLNEIEILLTQTRLMELYVKQAQTTAANQAAHVQEQHEAELNTLRQALMEKEQMLASQQKAASETEKEFHERVQLLEQQGSETQRLLDEREATLGHARAEIANLRERVTQLQAAKSDAETTAQEAAKTRQELQSTLAALRQELEGNQRDFQRQHMVSQALQENLNAQLEQLRGQLAERETWAAAGAELQLARGEITELRQKVADLQASRQEIEAASVRALEQSRARFETELTGLQTALSEREHTLRATQTTIATIEQNLRAEIETLRLQLGQKQELIELRDGELRAAHEQIIALLERIAELENANRQAAAEAAEAAWLRNSYESEIATLRHEAAARERALTERQEAVTAVELALHGKIQTLQQELARSRSAIDTRAGEVEAARAEVASLRERLSQLEAAAETHLEARQLAELERRSLEAELARLTAALAQKETLLADHETRFQLLDHQLRGEISGLRNQLNEHTTLAEQSHAELERLRSEAAILQEQKAQIEEHRGELEQNLQQATALRQELERHLQAKDEEFRTGYARANEQKEAALREQEARLKLIEEQLVSEIALLRGQLDQQQAAREQVHQELARLQAETSSLREQNVHTENSRRELEQNWQQAVAAGQDLEARLSAKDEELRSLRSRANEEKQALLQEQEARYQALEAQLGSEIGHLRFQLEQQQKNFEQGSVEISQLRAETATLHEQKELSEQARRELEQNWQQAAAMRQDFERQLQAKEDELRAAQSSAQEQKEAALQEQAARFKSIEEQLANELARLRSELDQQQKSAEQAHHQLLSQLQDEMSGLREQNARSEAAHRELEQNWQQTAATRQELESRLQVREEELRALQTRVDEEKEILLREQEARYQALEAQLGSEIGHLRFQLEQQQKNFEQGNIELGQLRAQTAALHEQKELSEQARRELEQNWQQAAAMRQDFERQLQAKEDELRSLQSRANKEKETLHKDHESRYHALETQLGGELDRLRSQLEQQQKNFEQVTLDLDQLRAETAALQEQKANAELVRRELEQNWQQTAATEQDLQTRLQAKEEELRSLQSRANEEKQTLLQEQEARYQALEAQLGSEIGHLRFQLEQQQKNFEQGNIELGQLRAQTAALHEQKELSEQARRELEQNWQQAAALRQEFEARLHAKDEELRVAQAAVDALQDQIEIKLAELRIQLTERQLLADGRAAEIDNLRAEIGRLVEQSAARESAAEEMRARLDRERQSARAAHQAEMAALRKEHGDVQNRLERQIAGLLKQSQELERRAAAFEVAIQDRAEQIAAAMAESAALRQRAQGLESMRLVEKAAAESAVEQARSQWQTELETLRAELQQKTWALAQQQASAENLALAHRKQIEKLEEKLADQQQSFQDRSGEAERTQAQTKTLQRRIEELEIQLQHAQLTAARAAEQVREEYAARLEQLNAQVLRHTSALQERESAQSQSEQSLRAEIDRLVREAEEKNLILQNRNDELVRAKSERDNLHDSYKELAAATANAEAATSADAERMRTEFQSQLALLQAELSQKEWALEEQRAAASGIDQQYREQIEALRRQLAQAQAQPEEPSDKFVIGDDALTEEQKERYRKYREVMDTVTSGDDPSFPASENRRWRSRFGWKRRWK